MADDNIIALDDGREALALPSFIVHADGKYYLTLAVWGYDPNHPDMTAEQAAGVEQVAEYHRRHHSSHGHQAVHVDAAATGTFGQHTDPQH